MGEFKQSKPDKLPSESWNVISANKRQGKKLLSKLSRLFRSSLSDSGQIARLFNASKHRKRLLLDVDCRIQCDEDVNETTPSSSPEIMIEPISTLTSSTDIEDKVALEAGGDPIGLVKDTCERETDNLPSNDDTTAHTDSINQAPRSLSSPPRSSGSPFDVVSRSESNTSVHGRLDLLLIENAENDGEQADPDNAFPTLDALPPKPNSQNKAPHECSVVEVSKVLRPKDSVPQTITLGKSDRSSIDETSELKYVHDMVWAFSRTPNNPAHYTGPVVHGSIPHGRGSLRFDNGDTYSGPFKSGQMHGSDGVHCMVASGAVYKGGFLANLRHGHGEHTVGGSPRYIGNYAFGVPNGYGEAYNANGTLFHKGQWENGLPTHTMNPHNPPERKQDACSAATEGIKVASDVSPNPSGAYRVSRYDQAGTVCEDERSVDSDKESYLSDLSGFTSFGPDKTSFCRDIDEDDYLNNQSILSLDRMPQLSTSSPRGPYRSLSASLGIQKQLTKEILTPTDACQRTMKGSLLDGALQRSPRFPPS